MDHTYAVVFSTEAAHDLESVVGWIKQDSAEAAMEFYRSTKRQIMTNLKHTPHMGSPMRLQDGTEFRSLVTGSYRVLYTVTETGRTVSVFRLLHTARDINTVLHRAT